MSSDYWTLVRVGYAAPDYTLNPIMPMLRVGRANDASLQCLGE